VERTVVELETGDPRSMFRLKFDDTIVGRV
jgi:hypothetical protein